MKPSSIKISALKSFSECESAIRSIEADFDNVVGGSSSFFSGRKTELKESAKFKIAAIERKQEEFGNDED